MIEFLEISDEDPALFHSPMVRAIEKTFSYIGEHGSIGLTPLKAFKRNFVHWAAAEFNWPHYSTEELFRFNKVLNEMDFFPVMYLHELLIALKIGRHYKGKFVLTKVGESLIGHPGKICGVVAPFFLFHMDHRIWARDDERIEINWDIFLNVLNVEAQNGTTGADIRKVIYGVRKPDDIYDSVMSGLYVEVLRPLCWMGLLSEHQPKVLSLPAERVFTKTPLWTTSLRLSTDHDVRTATRH